MRATRHNRPGNVRPAIYEGEAVMRVELTRGHWAMVDWDDWPRLMQTYGETWYAYHNGRGRLYGRIAYPGTGEDQEFVTLHRAVVDALPGERVSFINGDSLDCRKKNLYVQSPQEAQEAIQKYIQRSAIPTHGRLT
jgi:hypothetical protein